MKLFYELGYRYFRMPWEIGPRKELVELVESGRITPCRAIDLGCGSGDNAIFLAKHGFEVTGVDFAASAITKAKRKAEDAGVNVRFEIGDLTDSGKIHGTFDFLVDYGTVDDLSLEDRDRYLATVLQLSHPGSRYLLWCFEWRHRWWERLLIRCIPFAELAFEPGEAERRFGQYFEMERIAGRTKSKGWLPGYAAYLMTRREK